MICSNVLPEQIKRIPWGWKNRTISSQLCGQETYVVEPKGDLRMPDLISCFDWNTFIVEGSPFEAPLGTRNFKSIFTTACRLLGFERLLEEQPDLGGITSTFFRWNSKLIARWNGLLEVFFLGDDFAGNQGLFMPPETWRRWLKPCYEEIFLLASGMTKIFHSDGDIFEILDDLIDIRTDVVSYEPVGRMEFIRDTYKGMKMILACDQKQKNENSMRLQR